MESSRSILVKLFTEYYLSAAQAKKDGRPIAWITAFTPVEILRAMGLVCLYPESYAVVCAASKKSPDLIAASGMAAFSQDLCSYSLLSFGAEHHDRLPYGGLPEPEMLIATNNQCGTTLLWFKLLAEQKNIPLFVIDYPAAADDQPALHRYVTGQYAALADFVRHRTGGDLEASRLSEQIEQSKITCRLWAQIHHLNRSRPAPVAAHTLIDALFPIVVARGTPRARHYYQALLEEHAAATAPGNPDAVRLLWHGYPMWFLPQKFPRCFDDDFQIVLNDYTLWWALSYPDGVDDMTALAAAYSDTYLNRPIDRKVDLTVDFLDAYAVDGVICHANRSCRRALADIQPLRQRLRERSVPSVTLESDMCDPSFYSDEQVKLRLESFRERIQPR